MSESNSPQAEPGKARSTIAAVLLLLIASGFSMGARAGQAADPDGDKAKAILELALKALGGDQYLNMHTRLATGRVYTFFRDQTSGSDLARIYTEYLPDAPKEGVGIRERQYLGKKLDYSYLFLEHQAWELTFRGARPVAPDILDKYERTTQNDILYFLKFRRNEPGLYYDYIGSEVYVSRHVEIIDITDSERRVIRVSFDHNSHLPIRETFSWLDPETKYRNDEVLEFDKYRDIGGGVSWPFNIERSRNGYKTFQMFASSVEANPNPPDHTFSLPAKSKILDIK